MNVLKLSFIFPILFSVNLYAVSTVISGSIDGTLDYSGNSNGYAINSNVEILKNASLILGKKNEFFRIGESARASLRVSGTLETSCRVNLGFDYRSNLTIAAGGRWVSACKSNNDLGLWLGNGSTFSVQSGGEYVMKKKTAGDSTIYVAPSGGTISFDSLSNFVIDASEVAMRDGDAISLKIANAYIEKLTVNIGGNSFSGDNVDAWNQYFTGVKVLGFEGWKQSYSISGSAVYLDLERSAVPEPSMFGLLAGTLALALAGTRRRRRK